jgi:lysyl-tRNA synthetase class 2
MSLSRWQRLGYPATRLGGQLDFADAATLAAGSFRLMGQGYEIQIDSPGIQCSDPLQRGSQVLLDAVDFDRQGDRLKFRHPVAIAVATSPQAQTSTYFSSPQIQQEWFAFQRDLADGCRALGLLQVATPSLVVCPGMEPTLEPLGVHWTVRANQRIQRFLPTSPELSLKKLLSVGYTDFFEMRACFRAEAPSPLHATEFTMLEWYRGFADLAILAKDLQGMLDFLHQRGWLARAPKLQSTTMSELFHRHLDLVLTPTTPRQELVQALQSHDLSYDPGWTWDDCFHVLFMEKIEAELGLDQPLLVTHYPPSQAALARFTEEGWADRAELYWKGMEIANGFNELTDAALQAARFQQELVERTQTGRTAVPIDEEFLTSLRAGVPPTAGMALGVERLFMACRDLRHIQQLKIFPCS